jgi:hypothetical protein
MNVLSTIGLVIGGILFIVVSLVRVLHDLLLRGPHDAPTSESCGGLDGADADDSPSFAALDGGGAREREVEAAGSVQPGP